MLEIRVEFRSHHEWQSWRRQHSDSFGMWRTAVLSDIAQRGIIEPIGGTYHPPRSIDVNVLNLPESLSVAEMNSRKRAGLVMLEHQSRRLPEPRRRRPKLISPERTSRVARLLADTFSYEPLPVRQVDPPACSTMNRGLCTDHLPSDVFDLFYSSDVLEHVDSFARVLRDIHRLLRPGGILVATFIFDPTSENAAGVPGTSLPPGNGTRVPGWEVLDVAIKAGFADASMAIVASSSYGITSAPDPGVFVLSALKTTDTTRLLVQSSERGFLYQGPTLSRVIGIFGLPRSGTTILTSLLDVHSRIEAVYEPWNRTEPDKQQPSLQLDLFATHFFTGQAGKDILLVKETATLLTYLDNIASLLHSAVEPIGTDLILIWRDPFHVFLSEIEARRSWWGDTKAEISPQEFDRWAAPRLRALARMFEIGKKFNAIFVSYEQLVHDHYKFVPVLMNELRMDCDRRQLEYERHLNKSRVHGDVLVATKPSSVSDSSVRRRATQTSALSDIVVSATHYERIKSVADIMSIIRDHGVIRFNTPDVTAAILAIAHLL